MLKTKDLIEYIEHINTGNAGVSDEDVEKRKIIVRRLKDLDAIKQGVINLHTDVIAGELFENQE